MVRGAVLGLVPAFPVLPCGVLGGGVWCVTPGAVGAAQVGVGLVGRWGGGGGRVPAETVGVVECTFGWGGEEVVCGDNEAVAFKAGGGWDGGVSVG